MIISSLKNPKIVALRKLTQGKHRRLQKRFAVEGLQLIGLALETGHAPLEIFYCQNYLTSRTGRNLFQALRHRQGQPYEVSPKVMQGLSERDAPQGLIVTFPLWQTNLADLSFEHPCLVIVADRLQDPGNLGTLIRTADAVGAQAMILLTPCVDPFDPKTVRSTMGSIFTVPLIGRDDVADLFSHLEAQALIPTGADGYQGHIPWEAGSQRLTGSIALVLGNEARGLSPDVRLHMQQWARLPIHGQAESLNVAVAGGILMYQWLQQNS